MNILIKFPTRERPSKFFEVLQKYIDFANNLNKIHFYISMDIDDLSMNNSEIHDKFDELKNKINLIYSYKNNTSKVEAINSDMDILTGWDIVLLASDDMIPVEQGYDEIIRNHMKLHFPDTDGILWYDDGYRTNLATLSVIGKKYFDRFGYIYHPSYKSLWCDNEYQDVFLQLNKYCKFERVIIKHEHPIWTGKGSDALLVRNERLSNIDKATYFQRKKENFNL